MRSEFNRWERNEVRRLHDEGCSVDEIAAAMARTADTIRAALGSEAAEQPVVNKFRRNRGRIKRR